MDIVKIKKINEVYNKIYCEPWLAKEIDSFFTFKVPGYQYMPKYKSGIWNGDIHIFNLRNQLLYGGLNVYLEKFCKEREYEIKYLTDFSADEFSIKEAQDFISSLAIPLIPRDYQIEVFVYAIRNRRALLLSPTASGKSLIIYLISRWINLNILLIVPTTSLVHQMYTDFESYGYDSKTNCHMIYSGEDKNILKPVVITTWQSIFRLPKSWFDKFDCVIGDEAHLFQAKSLVNIMEKLQDCGYRYGFTGTLDGSQTHKLMLEGLFGTVKKVTTTKALISQKYLSDFRIKCIVLRYTDDTCKIVLKKKYQEEMDYIISSEKRNKFIRNLVLSLKGNTLLLFQYIEKHGKILYDTILAEVQKDRPVYFVYGGIEGEDRENIRRLVEIDKDAIVCASYGTFSTGINIRNLHNIVFASPSKSKIRNLQSIGRGLRLGDDKEICTLFDIVDDFSLNFKKNYLLMHFIERMKIYNEEKFDNKIYMVKLNE